MKEIILINKHNSNNSNLKEGIKERVKKNIIRIVEEYYKEHNRAFNPIFEGLNESIRQLNLDPVELMQELANEKKIVIVPGRTRYGRGYIKLLPANAVFNNKNTEKWKEELLK